MIRVDVRAPRPGDLAHVALYMREADKAEALAMALAGPFEAVRWSAGCSVETFAGCVDDVAVCLFGLAAGSLVSGIMRPWLLATDDLDRYGLPFARRNRKVVEGWANRFPVLENWVDARHTAAVHWLRWLGFTIEEPAPWGPLGMGFHRFWMKAGG